MQGKTVDMDMLRQRNELTPAVGNAKINARGDELGPGGKIVKKREDVMREYYEASQGVADENPTRRTKTVVEQEEVKKTTSRAKKKEEVVEEDDWIEDEDGNFVKKGE